MPIKMTKRMAPKKAMMKGGSKMIQFDGGSLEYPANRTAMLAGTNRPISQKTHHVFKLGKG